MRYSVINLLYLKNETILISNVSKKNQSLETSEKELFNILRVFLIKLTGLANCLDALSKEELSELKDIVRVFRDYNLNLNNVINQKYFDETKQLALEIEETIRIMLKPKLYNRLIKAGKIAEKEFKLGKTKSVEGVFV